MLEEECRSFIANKETYPNTCPINYYFFYPIHSKLLHYTDIWEYTRSVQKVSKVTFYCSRQDVINVFSTFCLESKTNYKHFLLKVD